ncbi:hypothetical protein [Streptomyces cavernae]|uniref:hypothetical protein n=1 Tax=Streptomyces cavernae TaxID=2259034 RepID=UPI000FEC12FC|nr:hypothetical protein [Streptomyces cavernae]
MHTADADTRSPSDGTVSGASRLVLPAGMPAGLGYDAVGTPLEYGERILACLPRAGCVFADSRWWWWIVPAGSNIDVDWPAAAHYAVDARVPDASWGTVRRRLIHRPGGDSPYTPPIPLYFMVCHIAGVRPHWFVQP